MTALIVNLRKAKKAKARAAHAQQGDENRAKFGEKTALKKAREAEETRKTSLFEQGKIEPETPAPKQPK
jgi:Domain of unknown function (DUF4169)